MSYTGTNEPLFRKLKTESDLFTKTAAMVLARMPDDEKKWPAQIHSELLRALPYIAQYDPEIVLDRVEPEAGAALGYVQIRNRSASRPQDDRSKAGNVIRVPIIVQDRRLQPFMVFEAGGQTFPLSEDRVEQAMLNPGLFDTDARSVPTSPSLVDAMYPPYQQRQGFGRVVDPGAAGLSKISSAPLEKQANTLHAAGVSGLIGAGLGAATGAGAGAVSADPGWKNRIRGGVRGSAVGAAIGGTLGAARGAVEHHLAHADHHLADKAFQAGGLAYAAEQGGRAHRAAKLRDVQRGLHTKRERLDDLAAAVTLSGLAGSNVLAAGAGAAVGKTKKQASIGIAIPIPRPDHDRHISQIYNEKVMKERKGPNRSLGATVGALPGGVIGAQLGLLHGWDRGHSGLRGAAIGAGVGALAGGLAGGLSANHLHKSRLKELSAQLKERGAAEEHYALKSAMVALNFQRGSGLPGPQVFEKMHGKPRFKMGVLPQNYWFYPLQGTPFYMGIHTKMQKPLEEEQNQQAKQKLLRSLAQKEIQAGLQGMPSPGALILITKDKDGYKYQAPMMHAGGRPLQATIEKGMQKGAGLSRSQYLDPGMSRKKKLKLLEAHWAQRAGRTPPDLEDMVAAGRASGASTGQASGGIGGGLLGGSLGAVGGGLIGSHFGLGALGAGIGGIGGMGLGGYAGARLGKDSGATQGEADARSGHARRLADIERAKMRLGMSEDERMSYLKGRIKKGKKHRKAEAKAAKEEARLEKERMEQELRQHRRREWDRAFDGRPGFSSHV
jgi:hypothetical protein